VVGWRIDDFTLSLTDLASSSVIAYSRDVRLFVIWATRGGLDGPADVDRRCVGTSAGHCDAGWLLTTPPSA